MFYSYLFVEEFYFLSHCLTGRAQACADERCGSSALGACGLEVPSDYLSSFGEQRLLGGSVFLAIEDVLASSCGAKAYC